MESNYSFRNSATLQGRTTKTVMYGSETMSNLRPKVWDILPTKLKRIVSPTLFKKKKIVNGPQRIVHVVYVKRMYKHWISVSCLYVHILFCKLKYFKHIQEYVEIVINSKPYIFLTEIDISIFRS